MIHISWIIPLFMKVNEFFRGQTLLMHFLRIPVSVDNRWFIVLFLMSWITARNIHSSVVEDGFLKYLLGFVVTLFFFASVLLHEFGHALIAKREKINVREIVLQPFGGIARLDSSPASARAEFNIAIAGPLTTLGITILFLLLWLFAKAFDLNLLSPFAFLLFLWNLLLAIFNLFPGYPLDGGRILRAYFWKNGKDLNDATILSGKAGEIIGLSLMVIGLIITASRGDIITGFLTIVVGFFLFDAARKIIKQINEQEGVLVGEVMSPPFPVDPEINLLNFVDNILPLKKQSTFMVAKERELYGVLILADLIPIPKADWHKLLVKSVMRPISELYFIGTDALLTDARILMNRNGIDAIGVTDANGLLVGYLQKGKIRRKSQN